MFTVVHFILLDDSVTQEFICDSNFIIFPTEPVVKRTWTKDEKDAVFEHLGKFIRQGKLPWKHHIETCKKNALGRLDKRPWKSIKYYVKYLIEKRAKNQFRRRSIIKLRRQDMIRGCVTKNNLNKEMFIAHVYLYTFQSCFI